MLHLGLLHSYPFGVPTGALKQLAVKEVTMQLSKGASKGDRSRGRHRKRRKCRMPRRLHCACIAWAARLDGHLSCISSALRGVIVGARLVWRADNRAADAAFNAGRCICRAVALNGICSIDGIHQPQHLTSLREALPEHLNLDFNVHQVSNVHGRKPCFTPVHVP